MSERNSTTDVGRKEVPWLCHLYAINCTTTARSIQGRFDHWFYALGSLKAAATRYQEG